MHSILTCNITFARLAYQLKLSDNSNTKEAANLFEVWTLLYFNEEGWQPLQDWITTLFTPLALVAHYSGLKGYSIRNYPLGCNVSFISVFCSHREVLSIILDKPDPRLAQGLSTAGMRVSVISNNPKRRHAPPVPGKSTPLRLHILRAYHCFKQASNVAGASLRHIVMGPLSSDEPVDVKPLEKLSKPQKSIAYSMEDDMIVLQDTDSEDEDEEGSEPPTTSSIHKAKVLTVSDRTLDVYAEGPDLRGVIKLDSPYVKASNRPEA
jgi:hypothetical protein